MVQRIARRRKALLLRHAGHRDALRGRQIRYRLRDDFEPRAPPTSAVVVGAGVALLLRLQDCPCVEGSEERVDVYWMDGR